MVASLQFSVQLGSWLMILAAFAGSMLCMGFVILMSKVINQMAMLIAYGVTNALFNGIAQLIDSLACEHIK